MDNKSVVTIYGLPVNLLNQAQVVQRVTDAISDGRGLNIITPYATFWRIAENDEEFTNAWRNADLALPDGISVLWAAKMQSYGYSDNIVVRSLQVMYYAFRNFAAIFIGNFEKNTGMERVSGVDLVEVLLRRAEENNWSVYFLGGWYEYISQLNQNLTQKYPLLSYKINEEVAKTHVRSSGSGTVLSRALQDIRDKTPQITIVSFGPPFQEKWSNKHSSEIPDTVIVNAGATIDFLSGKAQRAPKLFRRMGLEWLWRFFTEPKRIMRILYAFPYFPIKIMIGLIRETEIKR